MAFELQYVADRQQLSQVDPNPQRVPSAEQGGVPQAVLRKETEL